MRSREDMLWRNRRKKSLADQPVGSIRTEEKRNSYADGSFDVMCEYSFIQEKKRAESRFARLLHRSRLCMDAVPVCGDGGPVFRAFDEIQGSVRGMGIIGYDTGCVSAGTVWKIRKDKQSLFFMERLC